MNIINRFGKSFEWTSDD